MSKEIPNDLVHITITKKVEGEVEVLMSMNKKTFSDFQDMARSRGLSMASTIGEALRLEILFAEITPGEDTGMYLYSKRQHSMRKLIKV